MFENNHRIHRNGILLTLEKVETFSTPTETMKVLAAGRRIPSANDEQSMLRPSQLGMIWCIINGGINSALSLE